MSARANVGETHKANHSIHDLFRNNNSPGWGMVRLQLQYHCARPASFRTQKLIRWGVAVESLPLVRGVAVESLNLYENVCQSLLEATLVFLLYYYYLLFGCKQ